MTSRTRWRACATRSAIAALIAGVAGVMASPASTNALIDGIVDASGKRGIFCASCHFSQVGIPPLVTFEAPGGAQMAPGAIATFRFRITSRVANQTHAGFNVAADNGRLAASEEGTQALPFLGLDEITHTMPRESNGGVTVFEFTWRAPDTEGTYTLYGAGNSVNNNGDQSGDNSARTTIDITVIGPPTATVTQTPTPTVTLSPTVTASPTPTVTRSATPTVTHPVTACAGDCNVDGRVTVDEIVLGVSIALGEIVVEICPALDRDLDGSVTVDELLMAIERALGGCTFLDLP